MSPQPKALPYRVARFLDETEALALRISATVSISVIGMILTMESGIPHFHIIEELNSFDRAKKTKFPSGHVTRLDHNSISAMCRELVEEIWVIPKKVRFCAAAEIESTDSTTHYKIFFLIEDSTPLPEEVKIAVMAKNIELNFTSEVMYDNRDNQYFETKYEIKPYRSRPEETEKDVTTNAYAYPIVGIENKIVQGQFLGLARSIPIIQGFGSEYAMALMNYSPRKLWDYFV
jgi:hypothetical protein